MGNLVLWSRILSIGYLVMFATIIMAPPMFSGFLAILLIVPATITAWMAFHTETPPIS